MTLHPAAINYILMWPWRCWVSLSECTQFFSPPIPPLSVWSLDILQIKDPFIGCLPLPWLLLLPATNTAAVVGVKKLVSAPTLAVKEMCVFVFLYKVCVVVTGCHWYHWTSSVCVFMCVFFGWSKMRAKGPHAAPSLAVWLAESVIGGALLISPLLEKVAGSRHCGPQLREHDK